jgi:hypothetical protein
MDPLKTDTESNVDIGRLTAGMDVVSPAGETIGTVKEVHTHDFLLDRSMRRDLHVPFSAIRELGGRTVVLSVAASDVGAQGWREAQLFGGPSESDSTAPPEDQVVGTGDPADRGTWSASSDAYEIDALDTEAGRQATEGIDDGEPPHGTELPRTQINTLETPSVPERSTTETQKLRDMFG